MSLIASILLIAQVGPYTLPNPGGSAPRIPPPALEGREPKPRPSTTVPARPVLRPALQNCYALAESDPTEALVSADDALAGKSGEAMADPLACKAIALLALDRWKEAQDAFIAARDALPQTEMATRAELEAGAAIAAEGQGQFQSALDMFNRAQAQARQSGNTALAGRIARDKANSLFRLGRKAEAAASLNEARAALPTDAPTLLLSARMARITGKLDEAQGFIERAAAVAPLDAEVGLEGGLIAALAGRDDAARKSWQSVIATAPGTNEARQAQAWIAQLGPPAPQTAAKPAPAGN
ncbi:MAG: hypothetical protein ACKOPO_13995 [Novosphingobium sp.]